MPGIQQLALLSPVGLVATNATTPEVRIRMAHTASSEALTTYSIYDFGQNIAGWCRIQLMGGENMIMIPVVSRMHSIGRSVGPECVPGRDAS